MTVAELITKIRYRIFDTDTTEYSDNELMRYINDAILLIHSQLINAYHPSTIATVTLSNPSTPKAGLNLFKLLDIKNAVIDTGDTLDAYGTLPITVKYFKQPTLITAVENIMPFADAYNQVVEQIATSMALARGQYDVNDEKAFTADIIKYLMI